MLAIDIETFSDVKLKKSGVYRYVEGDFEILLFSYAFDDEPVQIVDLAQGERLPDRVYRALTDPTIIKTAYNAAFERICISKYFGITTQPWACTSVHALTLGLPGNLKDVAKKLRLEKHEGTNLINYFSMPCTPTKANGGRTRNYPRHDLLKWEEFKRYCMQDVEVERAVRKKCSRYPMEEQSLWELDQRINDRGIRIDRELVYRAIQCDERIRNRLEAEAKRITGLENPNSLDQLKQWFNENGLEVQSLTKDTIPEWIEKADHDTKRMLELRQELSKTSVTKYASMQRVMCKDDRSRGLFQFYGANRTGRWAGRLIQVHNLPRNHLPDLDLTRQQLLSGADLVPEVLSQLIRTAFIPSDGCRLIISDFNAIEARVLSWLAGEEWRLDVFRTHGKIYEASARHMFGVEDRQRGKVAELVTPRSTGGLVSPL